MIRLLSRADIDAAKERLRIPELWRLLNLPGQPKASCRSPFRDDKRASFSIFDEGRQAKDHATGEDFDGPAFLAKALGLSTGEALERFVAMAGVHATDCDACSLNEAKNTPHDSARSKPHLSRFQLPLAAELEAIARDRALDQAAPSIAKRLGCLKCGHVCGYDSWILTDPLGWNAEARRFERLTYPAHGELSERKAHTLKHSSKSWPVGLGVDRTLVERAALVAVVEGGPDYLAAWHFIYRARHWDVLPIAVLGRSIHGLHPDALALLRSKRIKFFPHVDPDDGGLLQIEIIGEQLRAIGCELSYFDFSGLRTRGGAPVKDLNDAAQLDQSQFRELEELFL
jgi:hypothetical protein